MARVQTRHGQPAVYNASAPTITDGDGAALNVDVNGNLKTTTGGAADNAAATGNPTLTGGKYNASAPTYDDGDVTVTQTDVNGNTKVTQSTLIAGEDLTNDVLKVEQRGSNFNISTATTTTVRSGAGFVYNIRVIGGTLGYVTVYDNTAASGTVLCPTVTPVQNGILIENCTFGTGLTILTAAATVITGSYRPTA